MVTRQWLAIAIGNTRIRAGVFDGSELIATHAYLHRELPLLEQELSQWTFSQVAIASVVPTLITPWHDLEQSQILTVSQIPIKGIYPTMGVDRALVAYGTGIQYGYPHLVIDAGTALTLTGVNANAQLVGGAIMSGLGMQLRSLNSATATLPRVYLSDQLPPRWAKDTQTAIQSGVFYSVLAGLNAFTQDWLLQSPHSKFLITGGDGKFLSQHLSAYTFDPNLIFWGMRAVVHGT